MCLLPSKETSNAMSLTINSTEIIRATAERILPDIKKWMGETPCSDEELLKDLCRALSHNDGYKCARVLDDWEPDSDLVAILDDAHFVKHEILRASKQP